MPSFFLQLCSNRIVMNLEMFGLKPKLNNFLRRFKKRFRDKWVKDLNNELFGKTLQNTSIKCQFQQRILCQCIFIIYDQVNFEKTIRNCIEKFLIYQTNFKLQIRNFDYKKRKLKSKSLVIKLKNILRAIKRSSCFVHLKKTIKEQVK